MDWQSSLSRRPRLVRRSWIWGRTSLSVGEAIPVFGDLLGLATGGAADKMRDMADKTRAGGEGISNMLEGAADGIHDTLIPALGQAQDRFNEFAGT